MQIWILIYLLLYHLFHFLDFEIIEILDVGICKFHLNKLECYYINKYDSYYSGYNNNNGHYMDNEGRNEFEKILKEYNLEFIDNELRKIND